MFRFAASNPQVAIMEGAEYIAYQQIRLAQKGVGVLPVTAEEPSDATALTLTAGLQESLNVPDSKTEEKSQSKRRRPNG